MAILDEHTNLYVDVATGSDTNGGSSFSQVDDEADCTAVLVGGTVFDITNNSANWNAVGGEVLVWDVDAAGDGP